MKKSLILIVLVIFGMQSMAQIQSGSIFVTGFGNISNRNDETTISGSGVSITFDRDKMFSATLGLGAGYFLTDNIAVGLSASVMGSKFTPEDTSRKEIKKTGYGAGVFARYYVPMSDNFYFFGQLAYSMDLESSKETEGGTETDGPKTTTNTIAISPGFTYFPVSRIGLDLTFGNLGWSGRKMTQEAGGVTLEDRSSEMFFNFSLASVTFGIQYFFGQ